MDVVFQTLILFPPKIRWNECSCLWRQRVCLFALSVNDSWGHARTQELHLGLPLGLKGSKHLGHPVLISQMNYQGTGSEVEQPDWS